MDTEYLNRQRQAIPPAGPHLYCDHTARSVQRRRAVNGNDKGPLGALSPPVFQVGNRRARPQFGAQLSCLARLRPGQQRGNGLDLGKQDHGDRLAGVGALSEPSGPTTKNRNSIRQSSGSEHHPPRSSRHNPGGMGPATMRVTHIAGAVRSVPTPTPERPWPQCAELPVLPHPIAPFGSSPGTNRAVAASNRL